MTEIFDFTSIDLIDDIYDGVTMDSSTIPDDVRVFEKELVSIIDDLQDKKLLWIKVPIERAHIIPLLTKYGFVFHHCDEKDLMMLRRLISDSIIPTAINHTLGVGAVVIEENRLLVIKDRIKQQYKLPGGYIDDDENISQALLREVFEETGVRIALDSIVSLGHFSPAQFKKSNLYIVCKAKALSTEICIVDTDEIIEARWMNIDEFFSSEEIHQYNKDIVKSAMKDEGLRSKDHEYFTGTDNRHEYYF